MADRKKTIGKIPASETLARLYASQGHVEIADELRTALKTGRAVRPPADISAELEAHKERKKRLLGRLLNRIKERRREVV